MENNEVETDNTQIEAETEETPEEVSSEKTPSEVTLTKEQKSKLDSFDRIYAENKELKEKVAKAVPKEAPKEEPKGTSQNDPKILVRLSKALGEYNEDEIDFIYQVAKDDSPEAIIDASKSDWVQTAIKAKREKVEKEKQIPEPGNLPGESAPTGLTVEDMKKDPKSHKKAWEQHMKTGEIQGREI